MANSKGGQGHQDKYYLDSSRKILSEELLRNKKALKLTVEKLLSRIKGSKSRLRSRSQLGSRG